MKRLSFIVVAALVATTAAGPAAAQKSALEHVQFDGVSTDAELRVEKHTRRQWLDTHPLQAKEDWAAWDCKDKPCDTKWYANIRGKAALIKRTDRGPPPAADRLSPRAG